MRRELVQRFGEEGVYQAFLDVLRFPMEMQGGAEDWEAVRKHLEATAKETAKV